MGPDSGHAQATKRGDAAALILDGHSRAALETLQSLGRMGVPVDLAAEEACLAGRSRYCRLRLRQPSTADAQVVLAWLEDLDAKNTYDLIVPTTETSLRFMRLLPESHRIRRAAALPSDCSLDIALDKHLTWELAKGLGVPVPASRVISSLDGAAVPERFPMVLKPATSLLEIERQLVRAAPVIARTPEGWRRTLERLLPHCSVLEQEWVPGRGVGVELLYRDGVLAWHFQHERLHELPLTGGGSSYRRSVLVEGPLLTMATRLLDSLRWHGVAMVEFKGSAEHGYRLMEINPRLWGSLALPIDAGVDFPRGLWRLAKGQDPGPQPRYRPHYYTRNLEMDFSWIKENLRADHSDPLLLTMPKLWSLLEYGRPLLGKESWDHFDMRDARVWSRVLSNTVRAAWLTALSLLGAWLRARRAAWRHRRLIARIGRDLDSHVRRILFVCYGNICRSPLAALHAQRLTSDLEVKSAGFHEVEGRPAPRWYQDVVAELGFNIASCRSRRLDRADVEWAQLVLLADLDNFARFEREFPDAMHKATLLGLFLPTSRLTIEDPYELDSSRAREVAQEVLAAVEALVAWTRVRPK